MTTIRATEPHRMKVKKMTNNDYSRIVVYKTYLGEYIAAIENEITTKVIPQIEEIALNGRIPYRLLESSYHANMLITVTDTALLCLDRDKQSVSVPKWKKYLQILKNVPSEDRLTSKKSGSEMIQFSHSSEGSSEKSMLELVDSIADYIYHFVDVKFPYLKLSSGYSPKVVGNLAIIHTGLLLIEHDDDQSS